MANYCSAEDVNVLLGFDVAFDANSRPTLTQVNTWITIVTKKIDFTLKAVGISTQPTDSDILGQLNDVCALGVACRIGMSGMSNNTSVEDSQPGYYCEAFQKALDEIKSNPEEYGLITGDETLYMSNQVTDGTETKEEYNDSFQAEDYEY
jgi:hypothetical protein